MNLPSFIPFINTNTNNCLTVANWQEIGINLISYCIEQILVKSEWLELKISLKKYLGWPGLMVLNASLKSKSSEPNRYFFKSPIDGRIISLDKHQLVDLIINLAPDYVIIPLGLESYQSIFNHHKIIVYSSVNNMGNHYGLYKNSIELVEFQKDSILGGDYSFNTLINLAQSYPHIFFESSGAMKDAINGQFYSDCQIKELNQSTKNSHLSLDAHCQCTICNQQLTQAYLTHLIQHTPLLAQRFLIQHNVYYCKNLLNKLDK